MNKKFKPKLFRMGKDGLLWYNIGLHNNDDSEYEIVAPYTKKEDAQKLMDFLVKKMEVDDFFRLMMQSPDKLSKELRKKGWKGTI